VILHQKDRIAHLEDLATTDELTGIKNRRGFHEALARELDRCVRGQSESGLLIMIDLDNFKTVNDTHGHQAGDAVLRLVAHTLSGEIRAMDVAARLGGDEFVLMFAHTTKTAAAGRIQRLGQRLNNLSLAWQGDVIPVRASLGLRGYGKGDKLDVIFRDADSALYASKKRGDGKPGDE
jgi:diguanylate cyclase (GGDEF)-like protein